MTTKMPVTKTAELLIEAKEILKRDGWMKGAYERAPCYGPNSHCLMGAVRVAAGVATYAVYEPPRVKRARKALELAAGQHVEAWNDTGCRVEGDVYALLDRAIAEELGVPALVGEE